MDASEKYDTSPKQIVLSVLKLALGLGYTLIVSPPAGTLKSNGLIAPPENPCISCLTTYAPAVLYM